MDTLNRVLLIILSFLIAAVSLVGLLLLFKVISPGQVQSVIPYPAAVRVFRASPVAASLLSLLALIVVMALSMVWLRGQYAEAVTSVVGGEYTVETKGPGMTTVNYDVVERAIDNLVRSVPGVVDSRTRIYSQRGGQLFAHTALLVRRDADIPSIDERIHGSITREWLNKLGSNLARHDITINIEPAERRVA